MKHKFSGEKEVVGLTKASSIVETCRANIYNKICSGEAQDGKLMVYHQQGGCGVLVSTLDDLVDFCKHLNIKDKENQQYMKAQKLGISKSTYYRYKNNIGLEFIEKKCKRECSFFLTECRPWTGNCLCDQYPEIIQPAYLITVVLALHFQQ